MDLLGIANAAIQGGLLGDPNNPCKDVLCGSILGNMIAIAMRESGGDPNAHCDNCVPGITEDSRGLWQINILAWPKYASWNMYDPVTNAKAMSEIYNGGSGSAPWGGTHGISKADLDAAYAAANQALGGETQPSGPPGSGIGGLLEPGWPFGSLNPLGGIEELYHAVILGIQWVTNPTNWKILGMSIAGGLLILMGIIFLAYIELKNSSGGNIPIPVPV